MNLTQGELDMLVAAHPELVSQLVRPHIHSLFDQQQAFARDRAKFKAAQCTRRAGKSVSIASWLIDGALSVAGGLSLFIALSKSHAGNILEPAIMQLNRKHRLGLTHKTVDNQRMIVAPNGHRIWLSGCPHSAEMNKYRGVGGQDIGGLTRVAIDEAQAFGPWLRELVDDVLEPGLFDQDGELALTGTPCAVPVGYFYSATTGDWPEKSPGPKYSVHKWGVLDNVFIKDRHAKMQRTVEQRGWTRDNPTYRREWLGEWVLDLDALVYPYDESINTYTERPDGLWHCVVGVDLGWTSPTAIVVGYWREGFPELYLAHCETHTQQSPTELAVRLRELRETHKYERIVVDAGGLGVGYVREMQLHRLPSVASEKPNKRTYQEIAAGELRAGRILVHPVACRPLIEEWIRLQWDEKREKEDPRYANHLSDAALYLVRAIGRVAEPTPLTIQEPDPKPEKTAALKEVQRRKKGAWWK